MSETPAQNPPTETTDSGCKPLKGPTLPGFPEPETCDQPCCCPSGPGGEGKCLDQWIAEQSQIAEKAEMAKTFADELRALQEKIVSARANYTPEKFETLSREWEAQDKAIVGLTAAVDCAVKCWPCLLECRLCPLLYEVRKLEKQLYGTGQYATQVDTLVELAAWHERNRNERQAYFDRIKAILAAWEDPAKKIADVLAANKAMIDGMEAMLASDQAGAIYTFFVKLLPAHWAIRPRTKGASKIPENFIKICTCGNEDPDECCGPDTSEGSVLQRLTPALPYLVDPAALSALLCCLVKERYLPAKELLAEAHAQYENAKANVERTTAQVKAKTEALEAAFKADLSGKIDCSKYWKKKNAEDPCTEPPTPPEPPKPDCPKPDTPTSDTPKTDTPPPTGA